MANTNPVDFLPDRIRQRRRRVGRLWRQGCLLACCGLALAGLAHARQGRIAQGRAELVRLDERAAGMQRQIALIAPLEGQLDELMIKKRIDEELGSRADCTAMLAELCRLMPPSLSLNTLELRPVDVPREALKPSARGVAGGDALVRRARVIISGLAPSDVDVANFIGQLSACPLFEDVNMGYAKTVDVHGRSAREFQASFYLIR